MPRSSSLFLFPDINVWLALSYERHIHHRSAREWFESLDDNAHICFCRLTQLGLLRLLTTDAVMTDEVLTQVRAWATYDAWIRDDRIRFLEEPPTLESRFRALSRFKQPAAKDWADSYLLAFAAAADLKLVTFDRSLRKKTNDVQLLA